MDSVCRKLPLCRPCSFGALEEDTWVGVEWRLSHRLLGGRLKRNGGEGV